MKTFKQYNQEKNLIKRTKDEIKKRHKMGNTKSAALRKVYAKMGYKGNPGDFDLDESITFSKIKNAVKDGVKKDWKKKVALALAPGPFTPVALAMTARDIRDAYKAQA